jgi:hypothetical protein
VAAGARAKPAKPGRVCADPCGGRHPAACLSTAVVVWPRRMWHDRFIVRPRPLQASRVASGSGQADVTLVRTTVGFADRDHGAGQCSLPTRLRGALGLDGGNLCPPVRGRAGTWDVFDRRKQRHDAIQAQALDRPLAFVLFLVAKPDFRISENDHRAEDVTIDRSSCLRHGSSHKIVLAPPRPRGRLSLSFRSRVRRA